MTVLMFASAYGTPAILQELINRSANITAQDMAGKNCIHVCCAAGKLENFQFLLSLITQNNQEAMLNQPTNGGITPLMFAVQSLNGTLVQACLAAGMNDAVIDYVGRSAMDYATEMGSQAAQIVQILQGIDTTVIPTISRTQSQPTNPDTFLDFKNDLARAKSVNPIAEENKEADGDIAME